MEHILTEFRSAYFIDAACKRLELAITSDESNAVEGFKKEFGAQLRREELSVFNYIERDDKDGLIQMLFDCQKYYEDRLAKIKNQMNDAFLSNPNSMSTIYIKKIHTDFLEKIKLETLLDFTNELLKRLGEV